MSHRGNARSFDKISRVYDATRESLEPTVLDGIADRLRRWGIRQLLEVGIGTGRVAVPLAKRGFEVTGVDASRSMLLKARDKGLRRLVVGVADALPFGDATFDGSLFVHVLHVLERPRSAIREACRAARLGAVALVEPKVAGESNPFESPETNPRELVYAYLRKEGFEVPARSGGPRYRDRALLAEIPPDQLEVVSDETVTEALIRPLAVLEAGGSRWTLDVPPEVLEGAIARARREIGDRTVTYRRIRALARWTGPPPPDVPLTEGSSGR